MIQKMPLSERLDRLETGYAAHPEYIPSVILAVAKMPIAEYFAACGEELAELGEILKIPLNILPSKSLQDIAAMIGWPDKTHPLDSVSRGKAVELLAQPIIQLFQLYLDSKAVSKKHGKFPENNQPDAQTLSYLYQSWKCVPELLRKWGNLYTDDYFEALAELCGDDYFTKIYHEHIHKFNTRNDQDRSLSCIIYDAAKVKPHNWKNMLLLILAAPFAEIKRRNIT